jgi:hypothetical protein
MPFKSEAQRRFFQQKLAKGEITQAKFDEWNRGSQGPLPEKLTGDQKINSIEQLKQLAKKKLTRQS